MRTPIRRRLVAWFLGALTRHRGVIVLGVCLPLGYVFDRLLRAHTWALTTLAGSPARHAARVNDIQQEVRAARTADVGRPLCTARRDFETMSLRSATYKQRCRRVRLPLRSILGIDAARGVVHVEPLVTMGQLTRYLLPRGFALAVHVEMEDLTVGGLLMGVGMETSSHRFGLIQETVEAYEVVLGDGTLVRATATEHPDLFRTLPWSHGTLGFLVGAELRIVPVTRYVHLTYQPCFSRAELAQTMRTLSSTGDAPDFLEAIVYSAERAVVMTGQLRDPVTPGERTRINRINRWHKPWFYKHAESFLERGPGAEYVPLDEYYHRHSRSIFWVLEEMVPFCHHPLYRWLFGWLGAPKISFLKLTTTRAIRLEAVYQRVVQDFILPMSGLEDALARADDLFEVYPLLIFPIRIVDHGAEQGFLRKPPEPLPGRDHQMFFDLGAYGIPGPVKRGQPWDAVRAVRGMEQHTRDVGGYQCLYADTFLTRDEFEQMFDHTPYRHVRARYGAEAAFPEVWDKVRGQW